MIDLGKASAQFEIAHGFGFNTNLLETNLINLAVVIGVLVYFGKGVLLDTLKARRANIVNQIEEAQKRLADAKAQLLQAQRDLDAAKAKANAIENEADAIIARKKIELTQAMRERQKRLGEANEAIISFENNKVVTSMRQRLFYVALEQVKAYLHQRITPTLHEKIIDHQLAIFKAMTKEQLGIVSNTIK